MEWTAWSGLGGVVWIKWTGWSGLSGVDWMAWFGWSGLGGIGQVAFVLDPLYLFLTRKVVSKTDPAYISILLLSIIRKVDIVQERYTD